MSAAQDTSPTAGDGLYDARGRWVPRRLIKDIDLARHDLVVELAERAKVQSEALAAFRRALDGDINAFLELSAEKYGVKFGKTKGNLTLTSYDGRFRIIRQIQDRLVFDERLQIAKQLVDECILEWSTGARDEIRALIEHAFQTDKSGKVSTERVLSLRRLDIDAPRWTEAMAAISDSIQVATSKAYLRFYERVGDEGDVYRSINLDLSST